MRDAAREPRAEVGRLLAGVENADLTSAFLDVVLPPFSACFLKSLSGILKGLWCFELVCFCPGLSDDLPSEVASRGSSRAGGGLLI